MKPRSARLGALASAALIILYLVIIAGGAAFDVSLDTGHGTLTARPCRLPRTCRRGLGPGVVTW